MINMRQHAIHIGTSGWSYKHWRGTFYPEDLKVKDQYQYYLQHFNTVEINNSFYRLPTKETFIKWKNETPADFVYVIKASRFITHMKKLHDPVQSTALFLDNVAVLDEKLGAILFQLPPFMKADVQLLTNFVEKLPKIYRYVFEFRNSDWYQKEVYELLKKYNCAFCIYELHRHTAPIEITADFVYLRLHGPGNKYQGSYSDQTLKEWAELCKKWLLTKDVFVYFDNDEKGYAAFNAITLQKLIENTETTTYNKKKIKQIIG
jgi:uncharacterized protein YecE (DUF72 family)